MRSRLLVPVAVLAVASPLAVHAEALRPTLQDVLGVRAAATDGRAVHLVFPALPRPGVLVRDGRVLAALPRGATSADDGSAQPASSYAYRVAVPGPERRGGAVAVRTPAYLVGAATRDITPTGVVNLGGYGLGDGTVVPQAVVGRGGRGESKGERIKVRAAVVDDGRNAVAVASIEVQGWFASYEYGKQGLQDMAAAIARDVPRLPVGHVVLASDHSHSAPDTLGVWGGPSGGYLDLVKHQVVAAVEAAYAQRGFADLRAGHSDASDLVYNQACTEALNQDKTPAYTGPDVCATPGKDGMVRVLQATSPSGAHPLTFMAFAAHATAGGGNGLHGDWPQFVSEELSRRYGGVGLAMVGALGGTQPCRPACSFTRPTNPGYGVADRKRAIVLNYSAHVVDALRSARPVHGPVAGAQGFIREPLVGPAVSALFAAGKYAGAQLLRNHEAPWVNGQTIRTVVGVLRVGDVVLAATPGEGFPRIRQDIADAVGPGAQEVMTLGLANDQLGYLISPAAYVPVIAAEVPVNDNIIFNVSPTIGDHVGCADIALAGTLGLKVATPPTCLPYDVEDAAGDPVGAVPVGGVVLP